MEKGLNKIKRDLKHLLQSQPLAVLATQQGGQPYASLHPVLIRITMLESSTV
jgi:predicted FMN-binding regulatory protein PaiB